LSWKPEFRNRRIKKRRHARLKYKKHFKHRNYTKKRKYNKSKVRIL
jgi:hypothetical protein